MYEGLPGSVLRLEEVEHAQMLVHLSFEAVMLREPVLPHMGCCGESEDEGSCHGSSERGEEGLLPCCLRLAVLCDALLGLTCLCQPRDACLKGLTGLRLRVSRGQCI